MSVVVDIQGLLVGRPRCTGECDWLRFLDEVCLTQRFGSQINQMNCFLKEGVSAQQYAEDTLDPIAQYVYLSAPSPHIL